MEMQDGRPGGLTGHNARNMAVTVEVRLFNSLHGYAGKEGGRVNMTFPAGSAIADILAELGIPITQIHLALRNGRDVTPSLYTDINADAILDEGDVIALSGPVPYSWGYGAPIV